jgi:hypothetical protein
MSYAQSLISANSRQLSLRNKQVPKAKLFN